MKGSLYLCPTPIGNLSDISERLKEILSSCDIVAAEDTRHSLKLLNHLGISKPMISYYEHNKRERGEIILKEILEGKNVALVSDAGTPAISDPGEDLVLLCAENGVEVIPIPGPCAAICALTVSALPTGRFVFEGFLPMNKKGRIERLTEIKDEKRTIIFYEAPHKLTRTLADLLKYFGDRKISLCRELTKIHEQVIRTTLQQACKMYEDTPPKGEFVLVVQGAEEKEEEKADISVEERFFEYINKGLPEKDAMKAVALDMGISKRDVYAKIKLKGKDENEV